MKVILEGPDNAGKTSLANRVREALGTRVRYFHPGGRPDGFQGELDCMKQQARLMKQEDVLIIDRVTAISQQVYSPSDDSEANYWRQQGLLELLSYKPVVIYCRPSTDRLMRTEEYTWREGESEEFKQSIIRNAHTYIERYDKLMQGVPNICYNFDEPSGGIIRTKLIQAMGGRKEDVDWFYELINMRSIA